MYEKYTNPSIYFPLNIFKLNSYWIHYMPDIIHHQMLMQDLTEASIRIWFLYTINTTYIKSVLINFPVQDVCKDCVGGVYHWWVPCKCDVPNWNLAGDVCHVSFFSFAMCFLLLSLLVLSKSSNMCKRSQRNQEEWQGSRPFVTLHQPFFFSF